MFKKPGVFRNRTARGHLTLLDQYSRLIVRPRNVKFQQREQEALPAHSQGDFLIKDAVKPAHLEKPINALLEI